MPSPTRAAFFAAAFLAAALLNAMGLAGSAHGQETAPRPSLHVTPPVDVSADVPGTPHVEPHLAAHPTDPDVLVGAAVLVTGDDLSATSVAAFRSGDGGRSWRRTPLPACEIDPWVAFGAADQVFVSCMGDGDNPLVVYRSSDGGRTWGESVAVPGLEGAGVDRPVIVVDPSGAPTAQRVYLAYGRYAREPGLDRPIYTPASSISTDSGRTFSAPEILRHDNLHQQPVAGGLWNDGTFFMLSMDYLYPSGRRFLAHRRSWISAWRADDRAFRLPTLVFEQTESQMPWSLAVAPSGRLHVVADGVWTRTGARPEDLAAASETNLFLLSSDDRGENWSEPVPVFPRLPAANAETPAVAVSDDGVVGVAWYDTRHDRDAQCIDVYFAASIDDGRTFLPAVRVTPEASCPRAVPAQQNVAGRWSYGGDYSGLAAAADGRFHVFWAGSRDGVYGIRSAAVTVER